MTSLHSFRCWLIALLAAFIASSGYATELVGRAEIVPVSATSVTIRWRTDVVTGTRFFYGLDRDQLRNRADGELSDLHEVTVQNLRPGATYYFALATAKKRIATGTFSRTADGAVIALSAGDSAIPGNPVPAESASAASTPPPPPTPAPTSRFSISSFFKRPAPAASMHAPPASVTWGHPSSLPDHFARHGADFGARDPEDYARMAWELGQRAKSEHLPTKVDETGVRRVFDPKSGAFAAYNPDGTTKTFFKPGNPGYFDRQPGRLILP